jgi:tetratricopeptide (TPR) repeat protein
MSIDTLDDATHILASAKEAIDGNDWPLAYGMLIELHGSAAVTDDDWTEVRYLLGEACWALDDPASARHYYEEAAVGAGSHASKAAERLGELDRLGAAATAAGDGVNADELTDVVNAAGEALMRKDYETAVELYQRAYALPAVDSAVQSVIINGFGECHLGLHHYDEAKEWFTWLKEYGDASFAEAAQGRIDELDRLTTAVDMASDGTKAAEIIPVFTAATEAYDNGDDDTALQLWLSLLENPVLPAGSRCGVLFNVAQVHIHQRDYDAARARFEEARQYASDDKARYIDERLDMLERRDDALHTAGLLPPE